MIVLRQKIAFSLYEVSIIGGLISSGIATVVVVMVLLWRLRICECIGVNTDEFDNVVVVAVEVEV